MCVCVCERKCVCVVVCVCVPMIVKHIETIINADMMVNNPQRWNGVYPFSSGSALQLHHLQHRQVQKHTHASKVMTNKTAPATHQDTRENVSKKHADKGHKHGVCCAGRINHKSPSTGTQWIETESRNKREGTNTRTQRADNHCFSGWVNRNGSGSMHTRKVIFWKNSFLPKPPTHTIARLNTHPNSIVHHIGTGTTQTWYIAVITKPRYAIAKGVASIWACLFVNVWRR